jgi:hypothetical protein
MFGEEGSYISPIPQVGCEISNPPEKTYFNTHTHTHTQSVREAIASKVDMGAL